MSKIIGIDLGTTNSCVAVVEGQQHKVIENAEGGRTTPSVIAYTENDEVLVGLPAKRQAVTNPENTLYAIKRLIGRTFDDEVVSKDADMVPYKIIKADNGDAWVEASNKKLAPPQVAAEVLKKMKKTAEDYLGHEVKEAVITVPAYFNDSQRQATKDAGKIAGLDVKRIINEPTAAALAYGLDKNKGDATVAVYDLGGGTFDISIIEISDVDGEHQFEVLSTNGDTFLGGEDFDVRIVDYLADEFKSSDGIDLRNDKLALQRLKEAVKQARHELSDERRTKLRLPFLSALEDGTPIHVDMEITRGQFEHEVEDLVGRCMKITEDTLHSVDLEFSDLDEVLLVGGVTRTPIVRKRLEVVCGSPPSTDIDPDRSVAMGAAIQAAALNGLTDRILLMDVTPHDLGIELPHDRFEVIVPRNARIPTASTRKLTTSRDNQTEISLVVRQGRSDKASRNEMLGKLELAKLRKAPRGSVRINLEFSLDASGVVHLNARSGDARETIKCAMHAPSGLDAEEVEQFSAQHRSQRLVRMIEGEQAHARNHLSRLLGLLDRQKERTPPDDQGRLDRLIQRGKKLLADGTEEEQLRMIRWLTQRVSSNDEPLVKTELDDSLSAPAIVTPDA